MIATRRVILPGLVLLTLIVYAQTTRFDFVNMDDPAFIVENPHIREGLTWESVRWAFSADLLHRSVNIDYWQPVTNLSRILDIQLYGLAPAGHHWTNVILHAANVLMLFMLLDRLTGETMPSAFAAALFAVHPMHAASVAWVTERKDLLSLFFGLLALSAWSDHARGGRRRDYIAALLAFALSLMAKPMTLPLPLFMLLFCVWPLKTVDPASPRSWAQPLRRSIPFWLLSAGSAAITLMDIPDATAAPDRLLQADNIVVSYATYLVRAIRPADLSCYYPYPRAFHSAFVVTGSLLLLACLTLLALAAARTKPWITVGWFWYAAALVPSVSTVSEATANRFAYLPLIGIYIIGAWSLKEAARFPRLRPLAAAGAFAAVSALTVAGCREVAWWKNSVSLFRRAIAVTDRNVFAHRNLGVALYHDGDLDGAMEQYRIALSYDSHLASIYNNMGRVEERRGRLDVAEQDYRTAFAIDTHAPISMFNAANLMMREHRASDAAHDYRAALDVDPDLEYARSGLADALISLGRFDAAEAELKAVLPVHPDRAVILRNLAVCYFQTARFQEWADALRATAEVDVRDTAAPAEKAAAMAGYIMNSSPRDRALMEQALVWCDGHQERALGEGIRKAIAAIAERRPIRGTRP